ncbi:MAG: hypothetical protein KH230_23210 [Enterocloster asparagiformis]|nr:hypothetical protein [Enterocloster asparagiformis]
MIGHSLSPVDWDYFAEVASRVAGSKEVQWFFGCHGLRDLENLQTLLEKLDIARSSVFVFRADDITETPIKNVSDIPVLQKEENGKHAADCQPMASRSQKSQTDRLRYSIRKTENWFMK